MLEGHYAAREESALDNGGREFDIRRGAGRARQPQMPRQRRSKDAQNGRAFRRPEAFREGLMVRSCETASASDADAAVRPSKVLASAATGVADLIGRCGGDPDSVFRSAMIRHEDIGDPLNELKLGQYCRLFEEAARQTGNEHFGLMFGSKFKPRQLGVIGYVAVASPTLQAGLGSMIRHFPVHQDFTSFEVIGDADHEDLRWLCYRIIDERIENREQDAALSLGMFCNIFREALGESWRPFEVRFEHECKGNKSDFERFFGAPVRFGRRTNAIGFHRDDLESAMPAQDPYLLSVVESFLLSRTSSLSAPEDAASVIRNEIKLHLGETEPSFSTIARMLGKSENSLRKTLRQNGLRYQDLLRSARRELSLHYLHDQERPLTDIAFSLGYSELSAFSRAFRNWTGSSPQKYRRHLLERKG